MIGISNISVRPSDRHLSQFDFFPNFWLVAGVVFLKVSITSPHMVSKIFWVLCSQLASQSLLRSSASSLCETSYALRYSAESVLFTYCFINLLLFEWASKRSVLRTAFVFVCLQLAKNAFPVSKYAFFLVLNFSCRVVVCFFNWLI